MIATTNIAYRIDFLNAMQNAVSVQGLDYVLNAVAHECEIRAKRINYDWPNDAKEWMIVSTALRGLAKAWEERT